MHMIRRLMAIPPARWPLWAKEMYAGMVLGIVFGLLAFLMFLPVYLAR